MSGYSLEVIDTWALICQTIRHLNITNYASMSQLSVEEITA